MNAWALLLVLVTVAGCTLRPAASSDGPPADRHVTLPSGATVKVAGDWTVTAVEDGVTLEDPQKPLTLEVVEVVGSAGMDEAIAAAWRRRRPGFDRQELASSDAAGREGWDLVHWSRYHYEAVGGGG